MFRWIRWFCIGLLFQWISLHSHFHVKRRRARIYDIYPNVVIIMADDLRIWRSWIYNKNSLIPTPIWIASFRGHFALMDAYLSCFGLFTHPDLPLWPEAIPLEVWKKIGSCPIMNHPMIKPGQLTLMQCFKRKGYTTAGFGKWGHLGASLPYIGWKKAGRLWKFKAEN